MQEQVEQRIRELKAEYEAGQKMLAELEAKQADLQQTVLRISGAIQALEELLAGAEPPADDGGGNPGREGVADGRLVPAET
jgi:prefoldin subunit 5